MDNEPKPTRRARLWAWRLVPVELAGVVAVCAGVAQIYRPAAFVVAGAALIIAVERG